MIVEVLAIHVVNQGSIKIFDTEKCYQMGMMAKCQYNVSAADIHTLESLLQLWLYFALKISLIPQLCFSFLT